MRPQKIDDTTLLEGLMMVFRTKGYDGASLNDLAGSSGLQKASLYHRFPGGKKDIAAAVLKFIQEWHENHIDKIVYDKQLEPLVKLETILTNITAIYDNGRCSCIMKALSMGNGLELFSAELKAGTEKWLQALTHLALDFGQSQAAAEILAMQSLVKIQGGLVVSVNLNNTQPFELAIQDIAIAYKAN
ncbi:MAG: TetR/AcrR family transcriptional regulator [Aureispira sp.]